MNKSCDEKKKIKLADNGFLKDARVTKLTKATYGHSKIEIRDILECHRIWEVAAGTACKPREVKIQDGTVINIKEIDDWKAKDSKARSVIRSTLDDTTFDQVCDCEISTDILKWALCQSPRLKRFMSQKH